MVDVRLDGVFIYDRWKNFFSKNFGVRGSRWYALVGLKLIDGATNPPRTIPEWFCLVVCSKEYQVTPKKNRGPILDSKYTIIMDEFELERAEKIIKERFAKVTANNWDNFYKEMEREFLYLD